MDIKTTYIPAIEDVKSAAETLKGVTEYTPLSKSLTYSRVFKSNIFLKREDLQQVRSYKIRGAYNKISSLTAEEKEAGVVCASAGNHAQGVAMSCDLLGIRGVVFMPSPTPKQKVGQTEMFGGSAIEVVLEGDTYDDAYNAAISFSKENGSTFVHPFDDEKVIEGQATVGLEILEQTDKPIDYLFVAVGGGGLASGLCSVFSTLSPNTKIIGIEPEGAPSMKTSLEKGENTKIFNIEKFVDGAAVQKVGDKTFEICKQHLHEMTTIPEGKVCQTILDLYNKDAIVVEQQEP